MVIHVVGFCFLLFLKASFESEIMKCEYMILTQLYKKYNCKEAACNHITWAVGKHQSETLFRGKIPYLRLNVCAGKWEFLVPSQEYMAGAESRNKFVEYEKMAPLISAKQAVEETKKLEITQGAGKVEAKGSGKGKNTKRPRDDEDKDDDKEAKKKKLAQITTEVVGLNKLKSRMAAAQSQAIDFKNKIEQKEPIWVDMDKQLVPLTEAMDGIEAIKRTSYFWQQFSLADRSNFAAACKKMDFVKFTEEIRAKHSLLTGIEALESVNSKIQATYAVWSAP